MQLKHSHGQIVAVPDGQPVPHGAVNIPEGIKMKASDIVRATEEARRTGRPATVDVRGDGQDSDVSVSLLLCDLSAFALPVQIWMYCKLRFQCKGNGWN